MTRTATPFVQAACVCEKVLVEADGGVSLVRIVDTLALDIRKELPPNAGILPPLTVFVALKSGDVVGEFEVGLRLAAPTGGKVYAPMKWPVVFNGGEHGVNLSVGFAIAEPMYGLYWFDVLWNGDVLTKIPFRLRPNPTNAKSSDESNASAH